MIKFEHTDYWGYEHATRGMRNPLESWIKNDTRWVDGEYYELGENDKALLQKLIKGGQEHRKVLRQIFVSVDITAPLYWWKEFDTYKVGTVSNSCSTMHKIHAKKFSMDDFSNEHLSEKGLGSLWRTIDDLNYARKMFLDTKDKQYWWDMIQLLPTSYNQKRTITMNYENLYSICKQRKGHKLDEWHDFIAWCHELPWAEEILFFQEEAK